MAIFIAGNGAYIFIIEKHPHMLLTVQKGMRSVIECEIDTKQQRDVRERKTPTKWDEKKRKIELKSENVKHVCLCVSCDNNHKVCVCCFFLSLLSFRLLIFYAIILGAATNTLSLCAEFSLFGHRRRHRSHVHFYITPTSFSNNFAVR